MGVGGKEMGVEGVRVRETERAEEEGREMAEERAKVAEGVGDMEEGGWRLVVGGMETGVETVVAVVVMEVVEAEMARARVVGVMGMVEGVEMVMARGGGS